MAVLANDLWAQARARIGMNFNDGLLGDENITGVIAALNSGVADFAAADRWDWLYNEGTISVVSGTTDYDTPANHSSTLWIARQNEQLQERQRKQSIQFYTASGTPVCYSVLNDKIRLYPTPTVTEDYRHGFYIGYPRVTGANLAALTASLDIPQQFLSLAELYVARKICLLVNDRERWSFVNDEIANETKNLRDDVLRASSPGVPQTRRDY